MNGIDLYDGITLHQGGCRDIMRSLPADHFDAVITDPPYGISFAGEKWDTATPHGFQAWAQSWGEEALRVIKPGGYLLAFSAPRTYHRLTSGLEDADFEIRDAMAWIRADGKPAGMDLSSAFDRAALVRRVRAEPARGRNQRRPKPLRSIRGGYRPVGTGNGQGSPPTLDTLTPSRRQTSTIRPVRRMDDGPTRRARHRPRPQPAPRTPTATPREWGRASAGRPSGAAINTDCKEV